MWSGQFGGLRVTELDHQLFGGFNLTIWQLLSRARESSDGQCGLLEFKFDETAMPVCNLKVGKIERPRPLRSTSLIGGSAKGVEDVLRDLDNVCYMLSEAGFSDSLNSAVTSLWYHIKQHGPQLEVTHKDVLDRQFGVLRDGCRDERLDQAGRVRLLELVELRAQPVPWTPTETLTNYYRRMLLTVEGQQLVEQQSSGSVTSPVGSGGMSPLPLPPLLSDTEVVRGSGRYPRPTQLNGRFKDELVIRNVDSGKAVHGAKERMLQVNGETEDNVLLARDLIDRVIRTNSSPTPDANIVRGGGGVGSRFNSSSSSFSSSSSSPSPAVAAVGFANASMAEARDRSSNNTSNSTQPLIDSGSCVCGPLDEYRYTVTIQGHVVKLSSNDLSSVKLAKVVLDEYFNGDDNSSVDSAHGSGNNNNNINNHVNIKNNISYSSSEDDSSVNVVVKTPTANPAGRNNKDVSAVHSSPGCQFLATSSPFACDFSLHSPSAVNAAATSGSIGVAGDSPLIGLSPGGHLAAPGAGGGCGDADTTISSIGASDIATAGSAVFSSKTGYHAGAVSYDRTKLLSLSDSPLARIQPNGWQDVILRLAVIARQTPIGFDGEEFAIRSATAVPAVSRFCSRNNSTQ